MYRVKGNDREQPGVWEYWSPLRKTGGQLSHLCASFQSMGREGGRQILMRAGLFCVSQAIDEDANS